MELNKLTDNFFDACFQAINEGTKIFDDDFVNKIAEKLSVDNDGDGYYLKETWKNGKLTDRTEKEWRDGKVIYSERDNGDVCEATASTIEDKTSCNCDKCNVSKIEKEYQTKLEAINSALDKLKTSVSRMREENDRLVRENDRLVRENDCLVREKTTIREKLSNLKSVFNKL